MQLTLLNVSAAQYGLICKKVTKDDSSDTLFIIGVPERHHRCSDLSLWTALAVFVLAFLMLCASSRITRYHKLSGPSKGNSCERVLWSLGLSSLFRYSSSLPISEVNVPNVVMTTSWVRSVWYPSFELWYLRTQSRCPGFSFLLISSSH